MELRRYGTATVLYFPLIDKGATDFEATPVTIATGDCKISKDGGAFANTTNNFAHVGGGIYSLSLTATEMQAKQVAIKIVDQTATKEWEDQAIIITTNGHASAEIPYLADDSVADLATDVAAVAGYIDTEVAAIKAKTDNLPSDPADQSAVEAAITAATSGLSVLDAADVRDALGMASANLDTQLGALPTAIENADALLTRDLDQVEASAPVHSLTSALLKLVSRFVAATGRTYRTNGSTVHMTQTPTTDAAADPVTELGVAA